MHRSWRTLIPIAALIALLGYLYVQQRPAELPAPPVPPIAATAPGAGGNPHWPAFLPAQAIRTLTLISDGGPFPYREDGETFGNYEHLLPPEPRGYYREYTVSTPGSRTRGARRIITGGNPPHVYYYTSDHYRSFRKFTPEPR
ncbi:MAG TPA: ribonuclease domain-containing protein [Rhodanobacteraceae bacterium]